MKKIKISSKALKAKKLDFDELTQIRKKEEIQAVEEMMKHPLSLEQKRKQIKRTHAQADLLEKKSK